MKPSPASAPDPRRAAMSASDGVPAGAPCPPRRRRSIGRSLLEALWQQPLYAAGFALFFGTLYGPSLSAYWQAFKVSLVFAFVIRLALIALRVWGLPYLARFAGRPLPVPIEATAYLLSSVFGSYVASLIVHFTLMPGFLGTPRSWAVSGAFSVLFAVTIGGIAYAIAFYRQSLARARAIEQMRTDLAEAELRALRAQVNPHFLFNTLNTIAALVRVHPAEAEETITRLADVFRYTLQASNREQSTLGDELEFVRAYLEIEHTRFGERLKVVEHIEAGLESLAVPSLLLQPLVENAVRHGISPQPSGGTVSLVARRDGDRLVVEVSDDGPGMDSKATPSGNGFGLHSVRERMRTAGPTHDFAVDSAPGRGTRVTLVLPVHTLSPGGPR
jgi:signal transduction histidine kinase